MVPQSRTPAILLTRPAPQSARFAQNLRSRFGAGIRIVVSPLLAARFTEVLLPPDQIAAVIFTSETAVHAARRMSAQGAALPELAFCVGDRTAETARLAGFKSLSAAGSSDQLFALIQAQPRTGPLLYLRGKDSRGDLAQRLELAGIETFSLTVYAQEPQPLSGQSTALLRGSDPVVLPLFSPRSAKILASQINAVSPLWVAALSSAVANEASRLSPIRMAIAARPDAKGMLDVIADLLAARVT